MDSDAFEIMKWLVATILASIPLLISSKKTAAEIKNINKNIDSSETDVRKAEAETKQIEVQVAETIMNSANQLMENYRDALSETNEKYNCLEKTVTELRHLINEEVKKREEAQKQVHRLLIGIGRLTNQLKELGIEPVWQPEELLRGDNNDNSRN